MQLPEPAGAGLDQHAEAEQQSHGYGCRRRLPGRNQRNRQGRLAQADAGPGDREQERQRENCPCPAKGHPAHVHAYRERDQTDRQEAKHVAGKDVEQERRPGRRRQRTVTPGHREQVQQVGPQPRQPADWPPTRQRGRRPRRRPGDGMRHSGP